MTNQIPQNLYAVASGTVSNGPQITVIFARNPTVNDVNYFVGQRWVNSTTNQEYFLLNFSSSGGYITANWQPLNAPATATVYDTNSGSATPSGGILNVLGSAGITTSGSGNTITVTSSGGSGITTIDGDTGSITGSTVTIFANQATQNSGSSVAFNNAGTISTLNVTDSNSNTIVGKGSGNATLTGTNNTGLGFETLLSLTSGANNTAVGYGALNHNSSGTGNTGVGASCMLNNTTGEGNTAVGFSALDAHMTANFNTAVGYGALTSDTGGANNTAVGAAAGNNNLTGTNNTIIGFEALFNAMSGSSNCIIGASAAGSYTGAESNNIVIGANVTGSLGESNTIRIGTEGTQTAAYIAGIYSVTPSPVATQTVVINSNGQLGAAGSTTYTPVLAFGGSSVGITYNTQTGIYTQIGNLIFVYAVISLTSAGSSTGNASVSLPIPVANIANYNPVGLLLPITITLSGGFSDAIGQFIQNTSVCNLTQYNPTTGAETSMTNANFSNTSSFYLSGFYQSS